MTKPHTEIFVLADHASISQEQKLSIIGIFDQFFVADLPSVWPKMYLVAVLKGEASSQCPLTLRLVSPVKTDQKFPDKEFKITFGPNGRANVMTELVNFPLQAVGSHRIQLFTGKEKIGELEYKVNKTTATYQGQDLQGKKVAN